MLGTWMWASYVICAWPTSAMRRLAGPLPGFQESACQVRILVALSHEQRYMGHCFKLLGGPGGLAILLGCGGLMVWGTSANEDTSSSRLVTIPF